MSLGQVERSPRQRLCRCGPSSFAAN